jgi:guanylate kinase
LDSNRQQISGKIFVVSAPSGAGKSSLIDRVKIDFPDIEESVSCTTRSPRGSEKNGVDYFFISKEEFLAKRDAGCFAEWAEVHGNFYGTPVDFLRERIEKGKNIICVIDYQGGLNIAKSFPDNTVLIFILPPSMAELERRLRGRSTESEEDILRRLKNAERELSFCDRYDFFVVNDSFDRALRQLEAVFSAFTDSSFLNNCNIINSLMNKDEKGRADCNT